jgi:hypothetical protein
VNAPGTEKRTTFLPFQAEVESFCGMPQAI